MDLKNVVQETEKGQNSIRKKKEQNRDRGEAGRVRGLQQSKLEAERGWRRGAPAPTPPHTPPRADPSVEKRRVAGLGETAVLRRLLQRLPPTNG